MADVMAAVQLATVYLLALLGLISLCGVIVALYICYRYDININVQSAKSRGDKGIEENASTPETQEARHGREGSTGPSGVPMAGKARPDLHFNSAQGKG